ncbi:hypothetical protein [Cytobacillus sp. IB215665]|uniref:hypothetical protein n=1 Tax=Cytobacillus sp. IB215665 TaxID=3097357 RepID=UPI002A157FC7|nr:hypothetical protein [Cytobacillus sp. IB215665]MDX8367695.1 hypothetical protein [Cytobacillus sp. IB215665]
MNVYHLIYFANGSQHVSIVVAEDEEQAEQLISKDFTPDDNYELDILGEINLFSPFIIHTEITG